MKKAVLAMMLFAGSLLAGPRITVGIGFGAPVAVVRPVCPAPGYVWVDGYYGPAGYWIPGFWRAPEIGVEVGPRYVGPGYFGRDHFRDFHNGYRHDFRR